MHRLRAHPRWRRIVRPAWWSLVAAQRPASSDWGYDRGGPIDRHYIETFLAAHAADVRGAVLEVKDSAYTERFGTGVTRRDVLDVQATNGHATVVADLSAADAVAADQYDCFILTQTLQLIFAVQAAIDHAHRILAPGGVLLATVPVVSPIVPTHDEPLDYWRFTAASCAVLFGSVFGERRVAVTSYGSYRATLGYLAGLSSEELSPRALLRRDARYPMVVAVRAVKAQSPA